jgi:hypothetical protein
MPHRVLRRVRCQVIRRKRCARTGRGSLPNPDRDRGQASSCRERILAGYKRFVDPIGQPERYEAGFGIIERPQVD